MSGVLVFFYIFSTLLVQTQSEVQNGVHPIWHGETVGDLHRQYNNIFRHGNRNAASHLWSSFLIDRSSSMSKNRLELMFSGYCAVSGSPVNPNNYNRYRLTLPLVGGGNFTGYMHYCCWPCVCDTQDFIRVDTKTIQTADGPHQYHFAVLGNPCERSEELDKPFVQPYGWGGTTTLRQTAPEVRCGEDGSLLGATLSDNGQIIIAMFFDSEEQLKADESQLQVTFEQQPGRISISPSGVHFQDERDWEGTCLDRANKGYNSGMGEIFRKVAAITPVPLLGRDGKVNENHPERGENCDVLQKDKISSDQ